MHGLDQRVAPGCEHDRCDPNGEIMATSRAKDGYDELLKSAVVQVARDIGNL